MALTVIYVDILLALNLFADYLLLSAVARVLHLPVSNKRLIAGALVGAVSSLLILLPPMPAALSALSKIAAAAAMARCAFRFDSWQGYLKQTAMLFLVSALFTGVCFAAWWLFEPTGLVVQSGVVYYDVPPLTLLLLTCVSYGGLCLFETLSRKRVAKHCRYRVEIIDEDQCILLEAMLDSGHSLCDGFSGSSVVLVKEAAVRRLQARYDPARTEAPVGRIRFIPYQSIGGDGVLRAFRPQSVTLYADDRATDISGVWIAPTMGIRRAEYDALIGPLLSDLLI